MHANRSNYSAFLRVFSLLIFLASNFSGNGLAYANEEDEKASRVNKILEEENISIVVVVPQNEECIPDEDWFCESSLMSENGHFYRWLRQMEKPKLTYIRLLTGFLTEADSKTPNAILDNKELSVQNRKSQLKKVLNLIRGNAFLFTRFVGDDSKVSLKFTLYLAGPDEVITGDNIILSRSTLNAEAKKKVSTVLQNMLLEIFKK